MAALTEPTLDRLLKETRIMLNQPSASNSFWSNDELSSYLNDAVNYYFQEVSEKSEGQFGAQADLDIVAATDLIALPSDCFEIRNVYKKWSTRYQILEYRNNLTEGYEVNNSNSSENFYPYYYFRGNYLVIRPVPAFSETAGIRIEYIAFPETMIWGGDTLSSGIAPTFKELIVLYAVWKAKCKESLVTGTTGHEVAKQLLDSCYLRFKDSVGYRSKFPVYTLPFNP